MKILDFDQAKVAAVYQSREFRAVIQSSKPFLINHRETADVPLEEKDKLDYERNFYSLLFKMKIKPQLHWTVMQLAGLSHPQQDFSHITTIKLPTTVALEQLRAAFKNTGVIKL